MANSSSSRTDAISKATLGGVMSALIAAPAAYAAQPVASLAETDNRAGVLLLLLVPVLGWVIFNIGQPVANQLEA